MTVLKKKKLQTSKKLQLQILEFNSVLFVWPKFITTGVSMGFVEPNIIDSFDAGTRPHTSDVSWSESWFLRWCWFQVRTSIHPEVLELLMLLSIFMKRLISFS